MMSFDNRQAEGGHSQAQIESIEMGKGLAKKPEDVSTVGKRLRTWRKASSMKLMDLSKLIKVSQGSLSDLENDKSLPSATTLANLCMFSRLNLYWLLTGEGPMLRKGREGKEDFVVPEEMLSSPQKPKMKEMIDRVIRIYQYGDAEKIAHLEGFLVGADPTQD